MSYEQKILLKSLKKRYRAEWRFKFYGGLAIGTALCFLILIFSGIVQRGYKVFLAPELLLPLSNKVEKNLSYEEILNQGIHTLFPEWSPEERKKLAATLSEGARKIIYQQILAPKNNLNKPQEIWLPLNRDLSELTSLLGYQDLLKRGHLRTHFNTRFLIATDSRNVETAGLGGAIVGSFYLMIATLLFSFPIGIGTALYLEEFASKNRFFNWIELSIANLAAVPSIVFGLLGFALFLNFFGLPRSSPWVGGMTLSLMTLPVLIIVSRNALKGVPKNIREAAEGLGASKVQVVFHHVFPLALPGILTGTIISMSRALGETAPLLMIGMMAFVVEIPLSPWDSSTALPVQIYNWAQNPESGFLEYAAGGILVLLAFLVLMNLIAILLRKKFEYKW